MGRMMESGGRMISLTKEETSDVKIEAMLWTA
jgi:hypothetical protein